MKVRLGKHGHRVRLPLEKLHRLPGIGDGVDAYIWCIHCERTYPVGMVWLMPDGRQMCPYGDCDGDTFFDAYPWQLVRGTNPGLPEVPEWGVAYPQWA